jgi:branched-chain amino acid transport system permease protein
VFDWLDISLEGLAGQLLVGLINGAFYAMLSLGLTVIFGLLNVINFAHGTFYMLGAFGALVGLQWLGIGYWPALVIVPIAVAAFGMLLERTLISRTYKMDHLYGFLLTYGIALIVDGLMRIRFGVSGHAYRTPAGLNGGLDLEFMFLPKYRLFVVVFALVVCLGCWFVIERTRLGAYLRAATENPMLVRTFGINVRRLVTLTFGAGVALAALAGVLAAPVYQASTAMGTNLIIIVFAVVVIGGMGSVLGTIIAGFSLGVVEGLTKIVYPEASGIVIFIVMTVVLLLRASAPVSVADQSARETTRSDVAFFPIALAVLAAMLLIAPKVFYSVAIMKALCLALFACSFNFLLGYAGVLSFGHAAFFGVAAYITGQAIKVWGVPTEVGILLGCGAAGLCGLIVGWLAIKRQGIYFAMITLACAQVVAFLALRFDFTGGEDGLQGVPRGHLFGFVDLSNNMNLYYFVLAVFVLGAAAIYWIVRSPFGHVLKAVRDNEPRAISLGYSVGSIKLTAFVISSVVAGLAGSMKVLVFQFAALTDLHYTLSGEVVLITLIGGLGTLLGPIVGAMLFSALEIYLSSFEAWVFVIQGFIFVAVVLGFRRGIVGEVLAGISKLRARYRGGAAPGVRDGMLPQVKSG